MYVDNIIRDIQDLIRDAQRGWKDAYDCKREAGREEDVQHACEGLDEAMEKFDMIEGLLLKLKEDIEMEALSHKVQSK